MFGHEVGAQRGDGAAQVRLDGARCDAERCRGAGGIQVEEQPQRHDLPLPFRQPQQRRHDPRIDRAVGRLAGRGPVREHAGVGQRHLPAVAPPPGHVRVQRGTDHPRRRRRMPADRAPARPRPGKGLGHQILRRVPVADAHQDGEQALIFGPAVELREVRSAGSHAHLTHGGRAAVTWAPRSCQPGSQRQPGQVGAAAGAGLVPDPVQVRADRAHADVQPSAICASVSPWATSVTSPAPARSARRVHPPPVPPAGRTR